LFPLYCKAVPDFGVAEKVGEETLMETISKALSMPVNGSVERLKQAVGEADLIIFKGQGNFETLVHDDPRIFFLFKAKCPVVARQGNCRLGDVVVQGPVLDPVYSP